MARSKKANDIKGEMGLPHRGVQPVDTSEAGKLALWRRERYELCKNNVFEFARLFFPHILKAEIPPFHKEIYSILPEYQYLAIEAFRGAAKSTIGLVIYPIWHSIFRRTGDITLVSMSESFVLNEIARRIKAEFESNELLLTFLGGSPKTPKWSESYFVLTSGIAFESCGIGGQLRGGRRGLIALDDLEDEDSAISEEQRDKLKRRIGKELIPKLVKNGQIIYFGTPVHNLCYLHQIIQTPNNGWEKRIYPAYKDKTQEESKVQWSLFDHDRLQDIKAKLGTTYFSTEYLCDPISEEAQPIKESMIRYWDKLPKQYSCVISVDPAYSEDASADYKVASVIAIDPDANRYLLTYMRTHKPTGEFIDGILNLFLQYKGFVTRVGIPAGGTEKEFYRSVVNRATERKIFPPFVELKNTFVTSSGEAKRNKKARIIASLQPLFESGKYYISPHHMEARDEILNIYGSRWDDICDTLSYGESLLTPVFYDSMQPDYVEEAIGIRGDTGYGL